MGLPEARGRAVSAPMSLVGRLVVMICWLGAVGVAVGAPWPEASSDQAWDPAWVRGTLDNGLRYAVRRNAEPRNRVTLRLLIAAGSLVEREEERGAAHLVEHMVFRGTKAYPGDSLNQALQRRGLAMGPDHTAFTGYEHTIYHLELPDLGEETLRFGLEALREYATATTFEPAALERERLVVMNEKASRDVVQARRAERLVGYLWPDSLMAGRPVIGTTETLRSLTREQLVAFYDAWYRPERMAVIAVGDLPTDVLAKRIHDVFAGVTARGAARAEPDQMVPAAASPPSVDVFTDTQITGVEVGMFHPVARPSGASDRAERSATLQRGVAFEIFQRRLARVSAEAGETMVAPSARLDDFARGWEVASVQAHGRLDNWQSVVARVEQEHRRAYLHGFTPAEVEWGVNAMRTRADAFVRGIATLRSEGYAGQMAAAMLAGRVLTTPEAWRDELVGFLPDLSPQSCLRAFRAAWEKSAAHVFVGAGPEWRVARQPVADAFNRSRETVVAAVENLPLPRFAYDRFGTPTEPVRVTPITDLDVTLAEYANGVRLNHKRTLFERDIVDVNVRVQGGRLSRPPAKAGLEFLAYYGFLNGGLGRHRGVELRELLAAHTLALSFHVDLDAFVFRIRCTPDELPLAMRVLTAHLTDAAYRADALPDAHAGYTTLLSQFLGQAGGVIDLTAEATLLGEDFRFGYAPWEAYAKRTFEELRAWMEPWLQAGAMEVSVVGDVDWTAARAAVDPTLGALGARTRRVSVTKADAPRFAKPSAVARRLRSDPRLKQVSIAWYFPVAKDVAVHEERRCVLLMHCLQDRLWQRLREELGATYGPEAHFVHYEGAPGINYFVISADVDLERADAAAQVIRKELLAVAKSGFSQDEFERSRRPFLRAREDDLRENGYWGLTVLADAQERPMRLAAARDRAADTAAITAREMRALARTYLAPKNGFVFVAEPAGIIRVWNGK